MINLKNLAVETPVVADTDRLGGAIESGAYDFVIELAYLDESKSGAYSANFIFKSKTGMTFRNTQYITSGLAKGQKNTYERGGETFYLPGYNIVNSIAMLAADSQFSDMDSEEKIISLYDYDAKKEMPQKRTVLVDLMGKEITLGLIQTITNKNEKDASGAYVPINEKRTEVDIDKVFHADNKRTVSELAAETPTAEFYDKWVAKNTGVTKNKFKEGLKGGNATPGTNSAPKKKLL